MRAAGIVLGVFLVTVTCAAPRESKPFHEHVKDFIGVIIAESGLELERLLRHYSESKEFGTAVTYFRTTNFRDLWHEIQTLPEFKAVIDYLDDAQIDVGYILGRANELIDQNDITRFKRTPKNEEDRLDLNTFIRESIGYFPKHKLAALFEQKTKEDSSFRNSVEKLKTEEWERLYGALWKSAEFKRAVHTIHENGLDLRIWIEQVIAVFGQNY